MHNHCTHLLFYRSKQKSIYACFISVGEVSSKHGDNASESEASLPSYDGTNHSPSASALWLAAPPTRYESKREVYLCKEKEAVFVLSSSSQWHHCRMHAAGSAHTEEVARSPRIRKAVQCARVFLAPGWKTIYIWPGPIDIRLWTYMPRMHSVLMQNVKLVVLYGSAISETTTPSNS